MTRYCQVRWQCRGSCRTAIIIDIRSCKRCGPDHSAASARCFARRPGAGGCGPVEELEDVGAPDREAPGAEATVTVERRGPEARVDAHAVVGSIGLLELRPEDAARRHIEVV